MGVRVNSFIKQAEVLVIACVIALVGNWIMLNIPPTVAWSGMLVIYVIALVSLAIKLAIPIRLPAFAYMALIATILTMPWVPISSFVVEITKKVGFLALCTPILAYAGISVGLRFGQLKKMSWRIVIVACVVFLGTFLGSAIVAQIILTAMGII